MTVPHGGHTTPAFAAVRDAFLDLLHTGRETGAAVAVLHRGRPVVEIWGGWRDQHRTHPWTADTLVHTYSVGKPLAALATLTAVTDGALDLDDPVTDVWPEYGQAGKERTTLRHLLAHQGGLPAFPETAAHLPLLADDQLRAALARAEPEFAPGTAHAEHALTYGHLLDGVLRGTGAASLGQVFRDRIARPLGLDAHFGVPAQDLPRVADLEYGDARWPTATAGESGSLEHRAMTRPTGALDVEVLNGPAWRRAEFPAIGLHTTASAIGKFYAGLVDPGGPVAGLLGERVHRELLSPQARGTDLFLGHEVTWSLGFQLSGDEVAMGGAGGSAAWVSQGEEYACAYVTRRLAGFDRVDTIEHAVRECLS
ncbi:serine hydrolase domain-containing protein [Actinoalloteichus caeruleus]|uniref:CubicO group peptidase, beta-lactamase class C family n=1 Tax=Actinoalloteichus caeruleus DSM 43889 TaxID=1120930 RepID=A0ABT1JH93_ACTCY|nr:serine hydrolase domain-containing protein [Actinoalloteichus caeruleus]MCP2331151.1 CubicO group peptidase, beta-lactamase class C family [Actinoalloteichus caeruleus DSM 43889]